MRHGWQKMAMSNKYHQPKMSSIVNQLTVSTSALTFPEAINDDISDDENGADGPPLKERYAKYHRQLPITLAIFLITEDIIPSHNLKGIFEKAEELINVTGDMTKAASAQKKMRNIKSSYDLNPHIFQPKSK